MDLTPFSDILARLPFFVLVTVRILAVIMTSPLLSIQSVPRIAKFGLAGLTGFIVFPNAYNEGWSTDPFTFFFLLLIIGEALLGVLTGLFVSIVFSAFSSAGQFFSYQMGFGASEVYDALAQIENPLLGQFFNLMAMLVFLQINGFHELFIRGIMHSVQGVNCFSLINGGDAVVPFLIKSLATLFMYAAVISLPVIGTLFLVHITLGLLSKAAPQMNLLSEGFPVTILVTFLILVLMLPRMVNVFIAVMDHGFFVFQKLLVSLGASL